MRFHQEKTVPDIHISFRFHIDQRRFRRGGLDHTGEQAVRKIIEDLDALNLEDGIPVAAAWDFSNRSISEIQAHAPDILENLQRRINQSKDEAGVMSWNGGLMPAMTLGEFRSTMERTIENTGGTGLSNLFEQWAPMVRPRAGMFTAEHLKLYPEHGIRGVSLYYTPRSNGFGIHMPGLTLEQRHNPLTLKSVDIREEMILMPCYSPRDLTAALSLRQLLKTMRKQQQEQDLLLIIDSEADDPFWSAAGRLPAKLSPNAGGFRNLVKSVAELPWLRFSRLWDYVDSHESVGEVFLERDIASGDGGGFSSWTEKRENVRLWTGLERARLMDSWKAELPVPRESAAAPSSQPAASSAATAVLEARPAMESSVSDAEAETARLEALSADHFGPAFPIPDPGASADAEEAVRLTARLSREALTQVAAAAPAPPEVSVEPEDLVPPLLSEDGSWKLAPVKGPSKRKVPGEQPEFSGVRDQQRTLCSGRIKFSIDSKGRMGLTRSDKVYIDPGFSRPSLNYAGRDVHFSLTDFRPPMVVSEGLTKMSQSMKAPLPKGAGDVLWQADFYTADEQPWVLADVRVAYPLTEEKNTDGSRTSGPRRTWDSRWRELRPFELGLPMTGKPEDPRRVWKYGTLESLTGFNLGSDEKSVMNNQISGSWLAFSRGKRGLMIGSSPLAERSFGFCPARLFGKRHPAVMVNPFGTYVQHGNRSFAPSYNGENQRICVLLIPYEGQEPPMRYRRLMNGFASPEWPGFIPWGEVDVPSSRRQKTD